MEKKNRLSTLKFVIFTILSFVLICSAVMITVLNHYKPAVKTYINGECIGYFSSPQQFDEVYNDLVIEKQNIDSNVKVYLESEPTFETSYIRESLLSQQNVYTNLRGNIKTEFIVYKVLVNNEEKMTFNVQDDANKYVEDLKKEVAKLDVQIKEEKVSELGDLTTLEKADAILKDIVDRNKPVQSNKTQNYSNNSSTNQKASDAIANASLAQGGIWPTISTYISSTYGWRWGTIHTGTDIAGKYGDPVYAWKDGLVTYSGWAGSYGNIVKIDHGNGISTWYAHCSKLLVKAGQEVSQGQTISLMGSTGFSTGNHLHFEVRINGVHVNSYPYIK
ncbi:MAG: M23 family metallopeptidase [Clostridia bacterium]|nr:M23 family metallopeptidase [Clostridia bacterium]